MPDSPASSTQASLWFIVVCALLTVTVAPLTAVSDEAVAADKSLRAIDVKQLMSQAARGDARASFLLGAAYASGQSVKRDDREAVYWFRNAAKKGLAEAQYNLAIMYATGTAGVKYNPATAAKWHQKAAEQGLAEAQYNLGTMYGTGRGVERDDKLAADWLRKAADQDMVEAAYNLAVLFEHGQGVPQDGKQALIRYQQAADAGYEKARQRLRKFKGNVDNADKVDAKGTEGRPKLIASTRTKGKAATPSRGEQYADVDRKKASQTRPHSPATVDVKDGVRSVEWFAGLNPDRYTLQILSLTREFSSRAFIKKHQLEDKAAYFAVRKNDQTWYAVTYGLYDSVQAAEAAGKSLPESIKQLKPWVRNTGRIQQSMLR